MQVRARAAAAAAALATVLALAGPATAAPSAGPGPVTSAPSSVPSSSAPAVKAASVTVAASPWRLYRSAMSDVGVATASEVVTNLVRLVPGDPRVRWRTIGGEPHVLVTTLRRNAITDVAVGQPFTITSEKWVSSVPEVLSRCRAAGCARMTRTRLDQRLKRLIGLPPDADYSVVNTFWVRPQDLFRPCTDPRVTSRSCPLQPVSGPGVPTTVGGTDLAPFLWGQATYAWRMPGRWAPATAHSCASSWPEPADCYGFPWTRLGYTYDWASGASEVGVTEFVVARGTVAVLERIATQQQVFGALAPKR